MNQRVSAHTDSCLVRNEVALDQVCRHSGQAVQRQKRVMRYYPAGKKCKLDYLWTGPYLIFIHCHDVKKIPSGVQSWNMIPPPGETPAVPMLGASTVAHTSQDSPSVTALPPDEGLELADVDYVRDGRSVSRYSENIYDSVLSVGDGDRHGRTRWFRKRVHSPWRSFGLIIIVPYTRFLHTNRTRDPFG